MSSTPPSVCSPIRAGWPGPQRSLFHRALLLLGAWILIGLIFVARNYFYRLIEGRPYTFESLLFTLFFGWWMWLLLTPIVLHFARTFPLERETWPRALLLHLGGCMIVTLLDVFLFYLNQTVLALLTDQRAFPFSGYFLRVLLPTFSFNLFIYATIVAAVHAYIYNRRYRERELQTSRLHLEGLQLSQAQLEALKMQLHPHFIFNTLHSISALMEEDVQSARHMMALMSELLRLALEHATRQEVTLAQEIAFAERYLAIQQIRFRNALSVSFHIAPDAGSARVPHLILQPLIENALKHGASVHEKKSRVTIRAYRQADTLVLQVIDNGPGLPPGGPRKGIGLTNTEQRLRQHYGKAYTLAFEAAAGGGLCITLTLPFYTEADPFETAE